MKFSRLIFFVGVILVIAATSTPLFATWNQIAQFPQGTVSAMYFFDASHGFIGLSGASSILQTSDGGVTWTGSSIPAFGGRLPWIGDIWFANNLEGYATNVYGDGTSCLLTTIDGGLTWNEGTVLGYACTVRRTSKALIVSRYSGNASAPPGISVSTDNGATFTSLFGLGSDGIDFVDDLHGAATGFGQVFQFTNDGGLTWHPSITNFFNEGWGIFGIKGTSTFVAVPEHFGLDVSSQVCVSNNYGRDWQVVGDVGGFHTTGDVKGSGSTFFIQKSSDGKMSGSVEGLYRSNDLGRTWKSIGGPSASYDTRIFVTACGNVLYAADATGGLFRSSDGGDGTLAGGSGSVRLLLATSQDPVRVGDTVSVSCSADRIIQNKGLTSITGVIEYYNDNFDLVAVANTSGLTLTTSPVEAHGITAHIRFMISGNGAFSLDPQVPLFTLRMRSMLSDSLSTPFWIDSLLLNGGDPNFNRCVLSSSTLGTISHTALACGDSLMQRELRQQPLLTVTNAYPNPVTSEHNYQAAISLVSAESGKAVITLSDARGEMISRETLSLDASVVRMHYFDLSQMAPGSYFYSIGFTSSDKHRWETGSLLLVR
jgi:hypothetical protein